MEKIVALTLVIGMLTAAAAIFATNHSRALAACVTSCEQRRDNRRSIGRQKKSPVLGNGALVWVGQAGEQWPTVAFPGARGGAVAGGRPHSGYPRFPHRATDPPLARQRSHPTKSPARRRAGLMYRAMTSAVQARPTQYATGAGQHYDTTAAAGSPNTAARGLDHVGAAILIVSVPPEILEPRLAQGGVARGVGDRDVTEPVLDRAGVDVVIGERLRFTRAALAPPFLNLARVPCGLFEPPLDHVDAHSLHWPQW